MQMECQWKSSFYILHGCLDVLYTLGFSHPNTLTRLVQCLKKGRWVGLYKGLWHGGLLNFQHLEIMLTLKTFIKCLSKFIHFELEKVRDVDLD